MTTILAQTSPLTPAAGQELALTVARTHNRDPSPNPNPNQNPNPNPSPNPNPNTSPNPNRKQDLLDRPLIDFSADPEEEKNPLLRAFKELVANDYPMAEALYAGGIFAVRHPHPYPYTYP